MDLSEPKRCPACPKYCICLQHLDTKDYEQVVSNNVQTLAKSSRGIKGRVTLAMLEDEPYAPVRDPRQYQEVGLEEMKEPPKKLKKKNGKRATVLC